MPSIRQSAGFAVTRAVVPSAGTSVFLSMDSTVGMTSVPPVRTSGVADTVSADVLHAPLVTELVMVPLWPGSSVSVAGFGPTLMAHDGW